MNKRVILLSGLVSLLSITGCGGNGNSNNNNKNSNSGNNKVTIENPWWTTEGSLDFDEPVKRTRISRYERKQNNIIKEEVKTLSASDWTKYEINVTAPSNSYLMKIECFNADRDTETSLYLDNFKVERIYG